MNILKKHVPKEQRKAAIELLKLARTRIKDDLEEFVCIALADERDNLVQNAGRMADKGLLKSDVKMACGDLRDAISELIHPYGTVCGWLRGQEGVVKAHEVHYENVREFRVRWIGHMINQLKGK